MSVGSSNVSSGSVGKRYIANYYEALPHFRQVDGSNKTREAAADNDLTIFAGWLKRYVIMVDHIVSYHPQDDNSQSATEKESALCQNVLDNIVSPLRASALHYVNRLFSSRRHLLESAMSERPVEADAKSVYFAILEFWCNVIFVDLDTDAVIEYDERMKQVQRLGSTEISDIKRNFPGALSGILGLIPDGKFVISVIGAEKVFTHGVLKDVPSVPHTHLPAYSDLLLMEITAFPIEVKKEMFNASRSDYSVQLANEKIENVTLDVKKGWSIAEIVGHTNFSKILQQGLRYLTGSSEVLCNHVIYVFLHHGVVHFAHLEIDLDALSFKDHPTDKDVKTVFLKSNTRKLHRNKHTGAEEGPGGKKQSAVVINTLSRGQKNEAITEKIVPVKFTAYPLETVVGKTKVPLLSGMVALIVLVYKLLLILKDPMQIREVRIKMMALRRALQKHTVKSSLVVSENRKRLQRESDDEDHTESQKGLHVSQDEKAHIDKKARSNRDGQTSEKKTGKSPSQQRPTQDYLCEQEVEYSGTGGAAGDTSTEDTTSGSSDELSINTNLAISTADSSVKVESSMKQGVSRQPRSDSFDELTLFLRAEDEGPLDYVTNDITLYSEPVIHTTMRALTLEKKFGIKLLCRGRNFQRDRQLASVLFMPQHTLRESVVGLSSESVNLSGPDLSQVLLGGESVACKFDKLAFKYYCPEILYDAYRLSDDYYYDDESASFSSFRDYVYKSYHLNEWNIMKAIQKHNDTAGQSGDYSKTIAIPKCLFKGDQLNLKLGRWGDSDDMGCFMVTEALTPDSGGWKNSLPLQESVVTDACNQIEVMTKQVYIRHNDLKLSNMIFTKGRVHFIDFGLSVYVGNLEKDELDEMVTEDQETIRELLLSNS